MAGPGAKSVNCFTVYSVELASPSFVRSGNNTMNKIAAALIAATFSLGAVAQSAVPAAAATPAATPTVAAATPARAKKPAKHTKHAKSKKARRTKAA
ncbi:MAG: hypothetical protein QE285_10780 [Aquabacterium sp.]|nr:hypothetical protein [Aquabacterium sp.]